MHALETLAQLCDAGTLTREYGSAAPQAAPPPPNTMVVPVPLTIVDGPRFPYRGLLVDTARHFLPLEFLLRVVDGLAAVKMNVLHIHFTDDESFPVQSSTHPDLARKGSYQFPKATFLRTNLVKLVAHAKSRGVRIVPEFVRCAFSNRILHSKMLSLFT
jgi:N-acetyl-beta-hexosaminidase